MTADAALSVIIPTRSRPARLAAALESLAQQRGPAGQFEVVVVDDGSSEPLRGPDRAPPAFSLRIVRQDRAGAAAARNRGASESVGRILVFMDDDVTLEAGALRALAGCLLGSPHTVAMGNIRDLPPASPTGFAEWSARNGGWRESGGPECRPLPCTAGNTQLLAVSREDFAALGGFRDPTGGWPNWDDVDFGYRAHLSGFTLVGVRDARATHWDASLLDLESSAQRSYRAARSAARLFRVHPGLQTRIPMFADKTPPAPDDPLSLRIRKRLRPIASSRPVMWVLRGAVRILEPFRPVRGILRHLYRWIIGGAIYRGYREGLQELDRSAPTGTPEP